MDKGQSKAGGKVNLPNQRHLNKHFNFRLPNCNQKCYYHYENTPMKDTSIFHARKNDNFHLNFFLTIFLFLLKTLMVGTR